MGRTEVFWREGPGMRASGEPGNRGPSLGLIPARPSAQGRQPWRSKEE